MAIKSHQGAKYVFGWYQWVGPCILVNRYFLFTVFTKSCMLFNMYRFNDWNKTYIQNKYSKLAAEIFDNRGHLNLGKASFYPKIKIKMVLTRLEYFFILYHMVVLKSSALLF